MSWLPLARRSFLSQVRHRSLRGCRGRDAGRRWGDVAGAVHGKRTTPAERHAQDNWLDELPGQHRLLLDTTSATGLGNALLYANNFLNSSQAELRPEGRRFGCRDRGAASLDHVRVQRRDLDQVRRHHVAADQLQRSADLRSRPRSTSTTRRRIGGAGKLGNTLDAVLKRGVHLAVCQTATRLFVGGLAQSTGGTADAVYKEVVGNLMPNSHMVPSGIVSLSRAQERGFTFASVG